MPTFKDSWKLTASRMKLTLEKNTASVQFYYETLREEEFTLDALGHNFVRIKLVCNGTRAKQSETHIYDAQDNLVSFHVGAFDTKLAGNQVFSVAIKEFNKPTFTKTARQETPSWNNVLYLTKA